ncbi:MAG: DUF2460 domain-containing protein [Alphaproteobacteria bacterium]|nr:DUF2460 domain-containing protein [Alphaproteobacteria bacterium]
MAFDEVVLPLRVGFGSQGGPNFSTDVVTIASGYERRNQNWAEARRTFDARTGVRTADDAAALLTFFHARAGRARGFRLKDWSDFSSAADHIGTPAFDDQALGSGDGARTAFPLVKNYTSGEATHTRTIAKPVADSVLIGVDGTALTTGWSLDSTTGIVTFASAPSSGQAVTAGFLFHVPVRFDTDVLSLSVETFHAYEASVPLVEIRV